MYAYFDFIFTKLSYKKANKAHDKEHYLLIYLLTYLLTPWSRVLLEKLTGLQLVKFPALYGNRMFITVFTSAHLLSLS